MSHLISLADAAAMTAAYRSMREAILQSSYQNRAVLPVCETFARADFDQLLAQQGCTSVRIYYGMDELDKVHAIVVGVDSAGEDILPTQLLNTEEDVILENSNRCPDLCPPSSPLNS